MGLLTNVINAALREHNVQLVGGAGSSALADALRSLLAPRSLDGGAPPDGAHLEASALQQLLARFQARGFADIIQSWIGTEANLPIEPRQLGQALGEQKLDELAQQTGVPRPALLDELARLLPTVIDRLTPQGKLPTATPSAA